MQIENTAFEIKHSQHVLQMTPALNAKDSTWISHAERLQPAQWAMQSKILVLIENVAREPEWEQMHRGPRHSPKSPFVELLSQRSGKFARQDSDKQSLHLQVSNMSSLSISL